MGSLVIVTADVCRAAWLQEMAKQVSELISAADSSAGVAVNPREGNLASAFYFRGNGDCARRRCDRD
jgi:hypothetical protein